MKTFLLSLFLLLTSASFSQTEKIAEKLLLDNINGFRMSKNLGLIDANTETNGIAKNVYEIYGKVESILLLNEIGISDNWALYSISRIPFNVIRNKTPNPYINDAIKRYMSDTLKIENSEWYYKDNTIDPKPFLFGINVQKIKSEDYYDTYELFFITLRNVPMKYKCMPPLGDE